MTFSRRFAFGTLAFAFACAFAPGCGAKGDDLPARPNNDAATDGAGDGSSGGCSTDDGSQKIASTVAVSSITIFSGNLFWSVFDTSKPLKGIISRWATAGDTPVFEFATRQAQPKGLIATADYLYWYEADGDSNKIVRQDNAAASGSKLVVPKTDSPLGFGLNADSVFAASASGISTYPFEGGAATALNKDLKITSAKAVAVNDSKLVLLSDDDGVVVADTTGKNPSTLQASGTTVGTVVALDDTNAYWLEGSNLRRAPLSGGTPDTLDSGVTAVTTLTSSVVWATYDESIGGIIRTATADGGPKLVVTRKSKITNIAAATSFVYWVEAASDTTYCVMRKPRS
jgi:hypothetical protein